MIHLIEREVYGNRYFYVTDPFQAEALRTLTKKKTLDRKDLEALTTLGLELSVAFLKSV